MKGSHTFLEITTLTTTINNWRTDIQNAIDQRHQDKRNIVCAFIASRSLDHIMYGFFDNQPDATQGINNMVKLMGADATYSNIFDMNCPK